MRRRLVGPVIHFTNGLFMQHSGVDADSSRKSVQRVRRQLTSAVAEAILDTVSFDDESTQVMDYACGSGIPMITPFIILVTVPLSHLFDNGFHSPYLSKGALSQKLAPYSKRIIGVDIDPAAVEQYNTRVANQGIPSEGQFVQKASDPYRHLILPYQEMRAICIDLHEHLGDLEGQLFDVIVVSPIPTDSLC